MCAVVNDFRVTDENDTRLDRLVIWVLARFMSGELLAEKVHELRWWRAVYVRADSGYLTEGMGEPEIVVSKPISTCGRCGTPTPAPLCISHMMEENARQASDGERTEPVGVGAVVIEDGWRHIGVTDDES